MSKEYYRSGRRSVWKTSYMKQYLIKEIIRCNIDAQTVFEFGCGRGENLAILKSLGYVTYGLEINPEEVAFANKRGLAGIRCGDEADLDEYGDDSMHITFTSGVMDHIPEEYFDGIMKNLWRITSGTIFCLETNDVPSEYYYPHNYRKAGFDVVEDFETGDDGARYTLWRKHVICK